MYRTGDVLFFSGSSYLSNIIKTVTKSNISHVGIIYNLDLIFETRLGINARLNPIKRSYKGKNIYIYRPSFTSEERIKIINLCHKYNGTPYSVWDLTNNLIFSFFKPKIRRKIVSFLGSKKMMICSEMTGKIIYETNKEKFEFLKMYEGMTPKGIFDIAKEKWEEIKP